MSKPIRLSPSTLNLFTDCPRCFWNHFHGRKRPESIFPSLPSGMDKVLKEYFDYHRKNKIVPHEIKEIGAELFDEPILGEWQNNFRGISWTDSKTGIVLHGAVDEMLVKDGKLIVLDFKTRGFPCKEDTHEYYRDQLSMYNFLLKKNNREVEDHSYLLFYHPKKVCTDMKCHIEFNFNLIKMKADPSAAEKLFRDAVDCILQDSPPKAKEECEWCGYSKE